jgi:hypothetical protein
MPRHPRRETPDPERITDPVTVGERMKAFDAETEALARQVSRACNGHDIRVVMATLTSCLAYAVVIGVRDERGLDAFVDMFKDDLYRLWARREAGLPLAGEGPDTGSVN